MRNWLNPFHSQAKQKIPARWLAPSENRWGLVVLDCTQNACTMMSTSRSIEIVKRYHDLRNSTGEELRNRVFDPTLSVSCSLAYNVARRAPDGPVFKSHVMEEKWDIYLYFCRSWGGELVHRAAVECEPPALSSHDRNESKERGKDRRSRRRFPRQESCVGGQSTSPFAP